MNRYWSQKASPWVTFAVLAGGLASAFILFFIAKVEGNFEKGGAAYNIEAVSEI